MPEEAIILNLLQHDLNSSNEESAIILETNLKKVIN